jgi:hypothetical protein
MIFLIARRGREAFGRNGKARRKQRSSQEGPRNSTFKLAYSRADPLQTRPTRSRVTPYALGTQPNAVDSVLTEPALRLQVPRPLRVVRIQSRANPCSLAATWGISIDFFSSADLYA